MEIKTIQWNYRRGVGCGVWVEGSLGDGLGVIG